MRSVIEQAVLDSWYYSSENPDVKIENTNIKMGKPSELNGWPSIGRFVIGAPIAAKKEIEYNSLYLSLYIDQKMGALSSLSVRLNDADYAIKGTKTYDQIALNAYNDVLMNIQSGYYDSRETYYNMIFGSLGGLKALGSQDGEHTEYYNTPSTRATSNKPKLKYTANDIVPIISNVSPQEGHIDERKEQVFSWTFALPETTGYVYQMPVEAGSEVEWRIAGSGTAYTLTDTAQGRITIPANTFPYGETIEWRVRVKTDDNVYSVWSAWFTLSTSDVPSVGMAQSPANQYIDAKSETVFRWEYSSAAGYPQSGFEAEVKYDTAPDTWISLFSGTGEQQEFTMPADTLSGGGMSWRIRVSNNRGTWSDWSEEVRNQVIAAPTKPVINAVDGSIARPTITWQSAQQLAFQMMVLSQDETTVLYDSDTINSKTASHKIPMFLENGQYIIRVRVMNGYAMWSQWGTANAFIEADKPSLAKLIAARMVNGIQLVISEVDAIATSLIVYRREGSGEYKPIKMLSPDERAWADYSCVGLTSYFVRMVNGDIFSDSETFSESPYIQHCTIAPVSDLADIIIIKHRRGDYIARNMEESFGVTLVSFEGRRLPVADFADASGRLFSFEATFISAEQFEKFRQTAQRKETVLYRDSQGRKIYGVIDNLPSSNVRKYTDISITIQEVDYSEVISYA